MKNKRKIKVPAAAYGINTNYETLLFGTDYTALLRQQGNAYSRMNNFQLGMANRDQNAATNFTESLNSENNNFFNNLKSKYGNAGKNVGSTGNPIVDKAGNIGEATFNAIGSLMDQFGTKSTARTGNEVFMQSVTDVGTQAANGYNIGKNFGGLGAAIGAGAGALIGLIGRDGKAPSYHNFVSGDEGTSPTGLQAWFGGRSKYKKQVENFNRNIYNNRAAVQGTNYLQNEAYGDLIGMNVLTTANGGYTNSLAYVDDGELIQTPDNIINKVPEKGKPTDSNLISLPEGSRILSDTLKVPGRKETFAQLADKMITKKKSRFNDRFAENAAKLNEMNNNMIYDQLFTLLEVVKQLKGIKPKYKQLVPAAETGLETGNETKNTKKSVNPWTYGDEFEYYKNGVYDPGYLDFVRNGLTQDMLDNAMKTKPELFSRFTKANPNYRPTVNQSQTWGTDGKVSDFHKALGWIYKNKDKLSGTQAPQVETVIDEELLDSNFKPNLEPVLGYTPTIKKPTEDKGDDGTTSGRGFDWGSLISRFGSLAPILSNLMATPETVRANYNPYETAILNTMRRRRYDVSSAIEDLNRNRATSNYNASQFNTNTGANLAYRLQSAVNTDRAIANLRTMENNYNNQYLADYANMANNLGQQRVAADNLNDDLNAQNRAAAGNIVATAKSNLTGWFNNNELMSNLLKRDRQYWPYLREWLKNGFTEDLIDGTVLNAAKQIKKKGGKKNGSKQV